MRATLDWKDYEMIDTSDGEKLERWGDVLLIRPDPQVIWSEVQNNPLWKKADARYLRSNKGGGEWEYFRRFPQSWTISYKSLRFHIRPTGFKHTGLFPEQAVNWDLFAEMIRGAGRPIKVLNLFAYTGELLWPVLRPGRKSVMSMLQKEWFNGQETMLCSPVWRKSRFVGLLMIVRSLFSAKSGEETDMMR